MLGYISVSAQYLSPEIIACYKSVQARYACFNKRREGEFEKAKEREANRRSILEAKMKLRLELLPQPKQQRENKRQEITKIIEASRSRNISHKGERYSLTYGHVLEIHP
ncbi:MAG: hypothetical protein H8E38_13785 [SAR324 cluster bacterium]|nr:hypothetical protein [SAR324 cluster bacterium]MBL7035882.1 hypothetical protein [SAR324 cluster bacterium]